MFTLHLELGLEPPEARGRVGHFLALLAGSPAHPVGEPRNDQTEQQGDGDGNSGHSAGRQAGSGTILDRGSGRHGGGRSEYGPVLGVGGQLCTDDLICCAESQAARVGHAAA
jgi:hypothetical protein